MCTAAVILSVDKGLLGADVFTVLLRTRWLVGQLSHVHLNLHKIARLLPPQRQASSSCHEASQRLSEWALTVQVPLVLLLLPPT